MRIKNVEDLLNQDEISWSVEDGIAIIELFRASPPNSRLRRLVEGAKLLSSSEMTGCLIDEQRKDSSQFASICDINSIMTLLSQDYSQTGTCNYYRTEDNFQMTSNAMALRASKVWVLLANVGPKSCKKLSDICQKSVRKLSVTKICQKTVINVSEFCQKTVY